MFRQRRILARKMIMPKMVMKRQIIGSWTSLVTFLILLGLIGYLGYRLFSR